MDIDGLQIQDSLVERLLNNRLQNRPTLLVGPAGSGKTTLARKLALGGVFRAPHYTVSKTGLCGTHNDTSRCEVTLAHNGILFLDEFPEFQRSTIDALHEAILHGDSTVKFWLVATMNLCPCGWAADRCKCSLESVQRYFARTNAYMDKFNFDMIYLESGIENRKLYVNQAEPK